MNLTFQRSGNREVIEDEQQTEVISAQSTQTLRQSSPLPLSGQEFRRPVSTTPLKTTPVKEIINAGKNEVPADKQEEEISTKKSEDFSTTKSVSETTTKLADHLEDEKPADETLTQSDADSLSEDIEKQQGNKVSGANKQSESEDVLDETPSNPFDILLSQWVDMVDELNNCYLPLKVYLKSIQPTLQANCLQICVSSNYLKDLANKAKSELTKLLSERLSYPLDIEFELQKPKENAPLPNIDFSNPDNLIRVMTEKNHHLYYLIEKNGLTLIY